MATVEIITGGKQTGDVVIATPQPMSPSGALPPDIGWVEISTSNNRGSIWYTGSGAPTLPAGQPGDMYLDIDNGNVYRWDGSTWVLQGTFAPSTDTPAEILAKLITVDGAGSLLDADFLDGHDSPYFATEAARAATQGEVDVLEARVDSVESTNTIQDGQISTINSNLALKANIASPTFTGDPKAPTPATADNDTSIATTAYVKANIATIPPNDWASIPGKPATFPPTLPINESDVTNLVTDLALKAPLASPVFTGDPRAPTPATADNDTSLATTAYVKANLATIVGGAIVSDTPPAGPAVGQLWFESDSGNTFIWYSDADSAQWVQVSGSVSARPTAETRNRLVNPAMQISQENGNSGSSVNMWHAADQWFVTHISGGSYTIYRAQSVTPNGSKDRFRVTINTADTSIAASDFLLMRQSIEGSRMADFQWGTANAKQAVLRFGWKSPAGTYSVCINGGTNRAYIVNFTIAAGQANTDTVQTFVIPGDTVVSTWNTDTAQWGAISVCLAAGTTFQGVAGWQGGNVFGTAANSNGLATTTVSFELYDVGLYLDPLASGTPPVWTMPDEAQELQACMRYYQTLVMDIYVYGAVASQYFCTTHTFPVPMRVAPAIVNNGDGTVTNLQSATWDTATFLKCRAILVSNTAGQHFGMGNRTGKASARM